MWRWKHVDNPVGPSPTWVALDGDRIVAVRTFLRWSFDREGRRLSAVRAVDTVTHPDHRGKGLFRRLTLLGLADLAVEGVDLVFNTPNDQSRPGYLSMGWQPVARLSVSVRPHGVRGAAAMARNRVPAQLSSLDCQVGTPAEVGLDDSVTDTLRKGSGGLRTARTADYLRWRYGGLPSLRYRVVTLGSDPADGVAVVRLRHRGAAREAAVAELAAPTRASGRRLLGEVLRQSGASYALGLPGPAGGLRVPRFGPLLVARRISTEPPPAAQWRLSLGDVELF
jgi:hypothetical protein